MKINCIAISHFHSRKCISNCLPQTARHFVHAPMCSKPSRDVGFHINIIRMWSLLLSWNSVRHPWLKWPNKNLLNFYPVQEFKRNCKRKCLQCCFLVCLQLLVFLLFVVVCMAATIAGPRIIHGGSSGGRVWYGGGSGWGYISYGGYDGGYDSGYGGFGDHRRGNNYGW